MCNDLKTTPLTEAHVALGARMAPFGGFNMPIQYTGILKEHMAAREAAALFDTCHMGEFRVDGPGALADLERLVSCDVRHLADGRCRYGLLCNEQGGVIDDLLVYRFSSEDFMLVVNAGTQQGDRKWIQAHLSSESELRDVSAETAKVDLQGPRAPAMMQQLMDTSIADLRFYQFIRCRYAGAEVLVSRTGYTGEIGFEFYADAELARRFWAAAMALGAVPAGLGARDTLRLEMGMPLYGHELSQRRNAAEAGFTAPVVAGKKYIGSDRVQDASLSPERLVGLVVLEGRRAARAGDGVADAAGRPIGTVTSGSMAPSLGNAIALAYVALTCAAVDTPVQIETARAALPARVVSLPFYKEATGRRPMQDLL